MPKDSDKTTLGLIVNPFAGIGGSVGLKGSDGAGTVTRALALGARQRAPSRAVETLSQLQSRSGSFNLITFPGDMGANEAVTAGLDAHVIGAIQSDQTTADDTCRAALAMRDAEVDLLLFVGGDGTARDIYNAIGTTVPALGIPAGVKIHSSVYAVNPQRAALLVEAFLEGKTTLSAQEVMDIDEELFRSGEVSARLYGYLQVPYERRFLQGGKVGSKHSSDHIVGIADHVIESMEDDCLYVLGPGTTVKAVTDRLGIEKTLLGVDILLNKEFVLRDANEQQILDAISGTPGKDRRDRNRRAGLHLWSR